MSILCSLGMHDDSSPAIVSVDGEGRWVSTINCGRCGKELRKDFLSVNFSQPEPEEEPPAGASMAWLASTAYETHREYLGLTFKNEWEAASKRVQEAWTKAAGAVLEKSEWITKQKEKNNMKWDRLKQQLAEHEGQRLTVYDDYDGKPLGPGDTITGHPTIGVGRCLDKKGLSHAEAMILLDRDINECVIDMERTFPNWPNLTDARQHALIDMRFNLGMAGFLGFKRFISAVKDERWLDAGTEMADSKWFCQVKGRAVRLKHMIETGEEVPR